MDYGDVSHTEPVRQSIFVLATRVLLLQFIVGLGSIVINLVFVLLIGAEAASTLLITMLSISNILIQTIDAVIMIYITLQWLNTSYVIKPDEILINRGISNVNTEVYKTENIESAVVEQSFLGKILKYGTIKFHDRYLKDDIAIVNIPEPDRYADIVRVFKMGEKE
jgi:uncharacterized membrane protein YdbT with pleckstrin-like domain